MNYAFHPEALTEFEQATRYFSDIQSALGLRFVASVESAIGRILESPAAFRPFEPGVRRCLTHIFPYALLYSVESDHILILAVMHCRREPGYWRIRAQQKI